MALLEITGLRKEFGGLVAVGVLVALRRGVGAELLPARARAAYAAAGRARREQQAAGRAVVQTEGVAVAGERVAELGERDLFSISEPPR